MTLPLPPAGAVPGRWLVWLPHKLQLGRELALPLHHPGHGVQAGGEGTPGPLSPRGESGLAGGGGWRAARWERPVRVLVGVLRTPKKIEFIAVKTSRWRNREETATTTL